MPASTSLSPFEKIIAQIQFTQLIQAIVLLVMGVIIAKLLNIVIKKIVRNHFSAHIVAMVSRVSYYVIVILFLLAALQQLGFSLSIFLGAAGILTVAIGFASQLSVSNLISGLFLLAEKPYRIGETIAVGDIQGEVIAIDALSIKLRTAENTLVRIPNETLIKSNIINLSRFPMRRFDLMIGVAYKENNAKIRSLLLETALNNEFSLKIPAPKAILLNFGDSAVNWQLLVYAERENYSDLKSSLQEQVKDVFEQHNIEMPYPTRTVYTVNDQKQKE